MRERALGYCCLGVALVFVGVNSASAQSPTTFSASYDFVDHELSQTSNVGLHADVAKPFGMITGVGEVGANRFDGYTVVSLAAGGRYALEHVRRSRIESAVQVLFGMWRCGLCEVRAAFLQPGVVIDYAKSRDLKIRVQFDIRRIFFNFNGETAERLSIGAVWELK